jgi:uncharacterized protein YecT (DUF1311 family)
MMEIIRRSVSCVLLASCVFLATQSAQAATTTTTTVAIAPPAIHEIFTLLPCSKKNDLGIEGCEEHKVVKLDKVIDKAEQVLFTMLEKEALLFVPVAGTTDEIAVAQRLSQAEADWLTFRLSECRSESDVALGGTDAALQGGLCDIKMDQQRLAQLKTFYEALKGHSKAPMFPKE